MPRKKYPQDNPDFKLSAHCRNCGVKGIIIVRLETNDYGILYQTHNKLDWCINPECFRNIGEDIPEGWIADTIGAFDAAKVHHRELRRDRQRANPYRKSYAESEIYSEAAMDAARTRLRGLEKARTRGVHRRNKDARGEGDADTESRDEGEALHDVEDTQGLDALVHPLG